MVYEKQVKIVESPWRNNTSFNLEFRGGSRLRWTGAHHSFSARFYSEVEARTYAEHFGFEVVESFPVLSATLEKIEGTRYYLQLPNGYFVGTEGLPVKELSKIPYFDHPSVAEKFAKDYGISLKKDSSCETPRDLESSLPDGFPNEESLQIGRLLQVQVASESEDGLQVTSEFEDDRCFYSLKSSTNRVARFLSRPDARAFARYFGLTFIDRAPPRAKVVGDLSVTIDSEAKMVYRVELETGSFLGRGTDAIDVFTSIEKAEAFAKGLGYEVVDCFEEVPRSLKSPQSKEST